MRMTMAGLDFSTFNLSNYLTSLPASPAPAIPAPAPAASTAPSWLQTLSTTAQQVLPGLATTVLGIKQQQALNQINIQRAQAGQPALDIAQYQEASAPVIKVQGGVDSGTSSKIAWGLGLGLGGVALAMYLKKQKARA